MLKSLRQEFRDNNRSLFSIYVGFALILILNIILDRNLLRPERFAVVLVTMAPLALASIGQMLVILTGGIDLSIGNAIALIACVSATTMRFGLLPSILLCILTGIAISSINGLIVTYGHIPAIIVTLAMQLFLHGIALIIMPRPGGMIAPSFFSWINGGSKTWAGAIIIAGGMIFWKILKRTRLGIEIYAIGDSEKVAYESGIKTKRVRVLAYSFSGVFTAMAGLALSGITGSGDANVGAFYTMNTIAATIMGGASFLGGQGQARGTLLGAMFITLLANVLFFSGLPSFYQYILQGTILIVAVGFKTFEVGLRGQEV